MSSAGPMGLIGEMEHTPGCEPIDRQMIEIIGISRPTVVVVPAASREKMVPVASERALRHWSRLGGKVRVALAGRDDTATVLAALIGGLGLLGGYVGVPHFDKYGLRRWSNLVSRRLSQVAILGVDECTGLIGRDGRLTVVGRGSATIIREGISRRFPAGTEVALDIVC